MIHYILCYIGAYIVTSNLLKRTNKIDYNILSVIPHFALSAGISIIIAFISLNLKISILIIIFSYVCIYTTIANFWRLYEIKKYNKTIPKQRDFYITLLLSLILTCIVNILKL